MNARAQVHEFGRSLNKSQEMSGEADWITFYQQIWPNMLSCQRVDAPSRVQTRGIDRMIWLSSGKQILIDEKVRDKTSQYDDILLETWSVGDLLDDGDYVGKKLGWAVDPEKHCDYVAYAMLRWGKCYLLPFELLRITLLKNRERWQRPKFPGVCYPRDAKNRCRDGTVYHTRNLAIQWDVLRHAMMRESERTFGSDAQLPVATRCGDNDPQRTFYWDESNG